MGIKQDTRPTLFYYLALRFLFYSNDHEPVHVHVSNGSYDAKFMVGPDIKLIKNKEVITSRWQEFFN